MMPELLLIRPKLARMLLKLMTGTSVLVVLLFCMWPYVQGDLTKEQLKVLEKKVSSLTTLTSHQAMIQMNHDQFKSLLRSRPRNYSIVMLFTALSAQRGCEMCHYVYDNFQKVAISYRTLYPGDKRLFFALVDFDKGGDMIFQEMQQTSAPLILHYPPDRKPTAKNTLDPQIYGFEAENIAKWLRQQVMINIVVIQPTQYTKLLIFVSILSAIAAVLYYFKDRLGVVIFNRTVWATALLVYTYIMLSGYTWVRIRGTPFQYDSPKGIMYIAQSNGFQLGAECVIVALLYSATSIGAILTTAAASSKMNLRLRKGMALVGVVCFTFFYCYTLSVFRMKLGGDYPYWMFFK